MCYCSILYSSTSRKILSNMYYFSVEDNCKKICSMKIALEND